MPLSVEQALANFSQRYVEAWKAQHNCLPINEELVGLASPCIEETRDLEISWQPIVRNEAIRLHNIEQGIELDLHDDFHAFYGTQYSADMTAKFEDMNIELLQVWSDEDLERLQGNMLGHLVMQRRLKLVPTLFVAVTDDEMEVVSICNQSGEVILDRVGTKNRTVLAANMTEFLNKLEPVIAA
ncbi:SecY-interacting protein [Aliivibrio fischeri]|uniref:SecY-interacting protein n=1 Tax=Aliivibrio fischeri TaxID=668 RepID=UPI0012D8A449|nr:SecY-interacting protein [Aliivibrio fischeri]MUK63355.1 SecY-interacting protein [Aliivibrio fischeri]MUK69466.1 SecY-interacting protein [Aliivibrio fischeri]MUK75185.1 SecY-interacting protein [Aliivibrio fischeri]MUL22601.1 SecY-interacting protein [Aliivibrio fischeri]MUL25521.1 SecY-interacting protein [Aliivibrio fischeri]